MPMLDCGTHQLHYTCSGPEGATPLLLLHSLGSSLEMWRKVVPALAEHYRVLCLDSRGHGGSSVPEGPYTLQQLGADAIALLDALQVQRAHVCGLSLGGLMAMWLALHHPLRVDRLILANTASRIGSDEVWQARMQQVQQQGMEEIARVTPERWFTPAYRQAHADEMEQIRSMVASTAPQGYLGCCAVLRGSDLTAQLSKIEHASLVVAGSVDPATPPEQLRALWKALPQARYLELEASHLSAWECSEQFADAVLAFLLGDRRNG
ncbi:MAG: 3-oxoadipate enol-lactonase [Acidobacteriota bacterium]|nr:3-oxoadipate enol-lactonase [Acidobacteriota bacterium]